MDVDFNGAGQGLLLAAQMQQGLARHIPLLFFSHHETDTPTRLAAVRAGGQDFLTGTLEASSLLEKVELLTNATQHDPLRVLVIDDSRTQALYTERVLATDELSSRIAKLTSLAEVNRLLEELAVRAELAARDGMPAILHEVLAALVQQEEAVERQEKRLAIGIVLRRLLSTAHLRLVAGLIPRQPEAREQILAVLARAENSGADAVLEHLVESESKSDRRAYFNALLQLPARETALIHMLGDQRWYVVRNAAELVGEMGLQAADGALVRALANEDDRVRKAAVSALGRLGTRTACHALRDLLRSEEGPLRGAAAMALAGTDWPYSTSALRRAFEEERDAEVRMVLLAALGRVGTDEAVAVLVEAATPPRRLLRRAASPLRVAAVRALAEAGTERARAALRRLTRDHDAEVAAVAGKGAGGA